MGTEDRGLIRECFVCFLFSFAGNSTNCLFVRFIADAVESKMGLVHEDDVDWFLTRDETHHEFSTVGARGGAAAGRYINPLFLRLEEQCIVSTFHTMDVYGTTLHGEPLIPLYILSMGSLREENYRIDSCVCEGLPTVVAAYGADEEACHSSAICVHNKGSMDTDLWHQLIRDIYTPCFEGTISPKPIRNPLTNKLMEDNGRARMKAKAKTEQKKNTESYKQSCDTRKARAFWVLAGRPVDKIGHPRLNKKDSLEAVKFLLPRVDIMGKLKLKDFNSMKKCIVWLDEIARGMTWDKHMAAVVLDI